jgi:hypothetical protein
METIDVQGRLRKIWKASVNTSHCISCDDGSEVYYYSSETRQDAIEGIIKQIAGWCTRTYTIHVYWVWVFDGVFPDGFEVERDDQGNPCAELSFPKGITEYVWDEARTNPLWDKVKQEHDEEIRKREQLKKEEAERQAVEDEKIRLNAERELYNKLKQKYGDE